jgi:hypothetical protein
METVKLSCDGRLLLPDGATAADPLRVLSSVLSLEDGCALRSFFLLLRRYPELLKLSGFLPAALADAEECPKSGCLNDEIALLAVGKTMELIGFPGKPRAEQYLWLRGLAAKFAGQQEGSVEKRGQCALSLAELMEADRELRFVPLRMLLDTPLFLTGLRHVVLGDVNRNLFCETRFTLFEVVDGLAWELGFQGGSQQCSIGR